MKDDTISRQAAIDAIDEIESEVADGDGFQYEKWRQFFCDLPSADIDLSDYSDRLWRNAYERGKADAESRKKGKWINCGSSEHWKCSCCGIRASYWFNEENSSGWYKDMSEWLSDYCPNCGADMRGEDE